MRLVVGGADGAPMAKGEFPSLRPRSTKVLSAAEWAGQNFGQVRLGDERRNRRALEIAAKTAAHPEASLPNQMGDHDALLAADGLLNNEAVTMEALLAPHCQQTLLAAAAVPVVLMTEDTTELDYTGHPSKTGLGPIGDGKGRALLLHSTLAVVPEGREVLGLAHAQVVLRQATPKLRPHWTNSPEAQVWEVSAMAVGCPPEGVIWVHVCDRGGDILEFMAACRDQGKHSLVRAFQNRVLDREVGASQEGDLSVSGLRLLDYARSLPPRRDGGYTIQVPARKKQPAREARLVLQWTELTIPAPGRAPRAVREHAPIAVWLLRVWEPNPP